MDTITVISLYCLLPQAHDANICSIRALSRLKRATSRPGPTDQAVHPTSWYTLSASSVSLSSSFHKNTHTSIITLTQPELHPNTPIYWRTVDAECLGPRRGPHVAVHLAEKRAEERWWWWAMKHCIQERGVMDHPAARCLLQEPKASSCSFSCLARATINKPPTFGEEVMQTATDQLFECVLKIKRAKAK